jgi:hypothetical protein
MYKYCFEVINMSVTCNSSKGSVIKWSVTPMENQRGD